MHSSMPCGEASTNWMTAGNQVVLPKTAALPLGAEVNVVFCYQQDGETSLPPATWSFPCLPALAPVFLGADLAR